MPTVRGSTKKRETYLMELVCERLTGQVYGFAGNSATRHGEGFEPIAVADYSWETGVPVDEVGFIVHPKNKWVGGSPDGLVGPDGLIEVKCPANPSYHLRTVRSGKVPDEYFAQVMGNLWVTGRQWADFISFDERFPEHLRRVTIRVPRDDEYIAELEHHVFRFVEQVEIVTDKLMKGN